MVLRRKGKFTALYTHHGPVMAKQRSGEWLSVYGQTTALPMV